MEYRIDKTTGEIYNEQEFMDKFFQVLPDSAVLGHCWDMLESIEVEAGKEQETREKLRYIYATDQASTTYTTTRNYAHLFTPSSQTAIKDHTRLLKLKPKP